MTSIHSTLQADHGEAATLENVQMHAEIDGLMAVVQVRQRYRNRGRKHIEAVYTFPLPLEGVLLEFQVELDDKRLVGAVVERADAARQYEDAITDGDAAVLLEQPQPGLYTASVGNLAPGETATVHFRYGLLLRWNGDRVSLMLPTTIAPRYGDPAAGGLAPHQSPVFDIAAERSFGVNVVVRGVLRQASWTSPSHDIAVTPEARQTAIALVGPAAMDRDLVLEARATVASASQALLGRDDDGWVALASFRPDLPEATSAPVRRSVKIVVDCSGSMSGDSIAQVRIAGERILESLGPSDLFDIVAFGSVQRVLFGCEAPATADNLARALRFVRELDADLGGTDIEEALQVAYKTGGEAGLRRDLLLITDGQVWDADVAIAGARASGHRIFTVGVGSAVAEPFVRALAEATGGVCELVAPRADMSERIHRHFQRMGTTPVQAVRLRWPGPARNVVPSPLPPPFPGDTMHIFGSFAERPQGAVVLEMELADGNTIRQRMEIDAVPAEAETAAAQSDLARLGASRRLAAIAEPEQATALAVRYQLMSEWTNYLVVHVREEADKADGLPDLVKVPQVLAAGWHGIGTVHDRVMYRPARHPVASMRAGVGDVRPAAVEYEAANREDTPLESYRGTTPAELVAQLNELPLPPLPEYGFFAVRLPSDVDIGLEALVKDGMDGGMDEEWMKIVFLHLLAESEAGDALAREVRRHILAAWKKLSLDESAVAAVRQIVEAWLAG